MAPAGGKVSPTASNAPISARAPSPRPLERKRGRRTRQREAPLLRGRLDDERLLTRGAHLGARRQRHPWYDSGMTQKIAVSLPDEQVVSIRRAVEQVASSCGFGSAVTMRQAFARILSTTPSAYRRRFRTVSPDPATT